MTTISDTTLYFISAVRAFDNGELPFTDLVDDVKRHETMMRDGRSSKSTLSDDHNVRLLDIFSLDFSLHSREQRIISEASEIKDKLLFQSTTRYNRNHPIMPAIVTQEEFRKNWASFTGSCLTYLMDWTNVVAAGGCVQTCLSPVPDSYHETPYSRWKYMRGTHLADSDIDLFIFGVSSIQARAKARHIFDAIRQFDHDANLAERGELFVVYCSIPYRKIQIVVTQYPSPLELLLDFDIDACCCIYDGTNVFTSLRGAAALLWKTNTINIDLHSVTYELRLTKYACRGFNVFLHGFQRNKVRESLFDQTSADVFGLERLLLLERDISRSKTRQTRALNLRYLYRRHYDEIESSYRFPENGPGDDDQKDNVVHSTDSNISRYSIEYDHETEDDAEHSSDDMIQRHMFETIQDWYGSAFGQDSELL